MISLQVGRQRASSPSSHLKQERRRKRRIRAGKDDECHNKKSSRYLKAKYFNQLSSNSSPNTGTVRSSPHSPLSLSSSLLSSPLTGSVSQLQCDMPAVNVRSHLAAVTPAPLPLLPRSRMDGGMERWRSAARLKRRTSLRCAAACSFKKPPLGQ